jgi:hypothetical protein
VFPTWHYCLQPWDCECFQNPRQDVLWDLYKINFSVTTKELCLVKYVRQYLEHKSHPLDVREPSGCVASLLLLVDEVDLWRVPYKFLDNWMYKSSITWKKSILKMIENYSSPHFSSIWNSLVFVSIHFWKHSLGDDREELNKQTVSSKLFTWWEPMSSTSQILGIKPGSFS